MHGAQLGALLRIQTRFVPTHRLIKETIMAISITNAIDQAKEWLLNNQDPEGGWGERPGTGVSALNTAEAVIAILDAGLSPGDGRVQDGIEFLKTHQCREGPDAGAWMRDFQDAHEQNCQVADIVRSSFILQALIKAGVGVKEDPVKDGVNWLLSIRREEKGHQAWGFRPDGPLTLMGTSFALLALMEAYGANLTDLRKHIEAGLKYLVERCRNPSGSFGEKGPLEAVHTIYAAMVLQMARQRELGAYSKQEDVAIEWLLANPTVASKVVEETISIVPEDSPEERQANYGFLFMTDALLVKVLLNSRFRDSKLAREAIIGLDKKRDGENGGFYGHRVFSWSTAKAISALSAAAPHFQDFPVLAPEYTGMKTGNFILALAILLAAAVVYMTSLNNFTWVHASVFMVLMLAVLLAYGVIGEKTFKELVIALIKRKN